MHCTLAKGTSISGDPRATKIRFFILCNGPHRNMCVRNRRNSKCKVWQLFREEKGYTYSSMLCCHSDSLAEGPTHLQVPLVVVVVVVVGGGGGGGGGHLLSSFPPLFLIALFNVALSAALCQLFNVDLQQLLTAFNRVLAAHTEDDGI
eukprot:1156174-Pelagomonas_calceolata.AAC.1